VPLKISGIEMEEKAKVIEAFTEMAPHYEQIVDSELHRFWGVSYLSFVRRLLASIPLRQSDVILDVATGTGVIPNQLHNNGHPRSLVHALDITFSMLRHAARRLSDDGNPSALNLACASAFDMPYADSIFSAVICGLATHHMDVVKMVRESYRVLKNPGSLAIGDVGGSPAWKLPGMRFLLRIIAFVYFFLAENKSRAWAETSAVANVLSSEDWTRMLQEAGFRNIVVQKLKSRFFWVPSPLLIRADK
jgi:ubiquinone/menaquinone biosynthesis C-methylase UbiE